MATATEYRVITDRATEITPGSSKDITFTLRTPDASHSVLMFNVVIENPSHDQPFSFKLNGETYTYGLGSTARRGLHEVLSATALRDGSNKLTLSSPAGAGTGTARFTDIVLLYRRAA